MPDREKVLTAMECCAVGAECDHCPYSMLNKEGYEGCHQMHWDAIELLDKQKPKIMRLPEALGSYDPIFAEFRNLVGDGKTFTKWVDAVISMDARHVTITDLYCEETESRKLDFGFNLYNRVFRFWSTKPTDEQRKAVPWETH